MRPAQWANKSSLYDVSDAVAGARLTASPTSVEAGKRVSFNQNGGRFARRRWWSLSGSNRRPPACKAGALPAELRPLFLSRSSSTLGAERPSSRSAPQMNLRVVGLARPFVSRCEQGARWTQPHRARVGRRPTAPRASRGKYGGHGWTRTIDLTLIRRTL